ncbi:hypothetical protein ABZ281_10270 [Streptomyces sp. NPDC006265]
MGSPGAVVGVAGRQGPVADWLGADVEDVDIPRRQVRVRKPVRPDKAWFR